MTSLGMGADLAGGDVGGVGPGVRAGLDGHTRAVEAEGEDGPLALHAVEGHRELRLRQGEGVAQVQAPVHVRVRERGQELALGRPVLALLGGVNLEGFGRLATPPSHRRERHGAPPGAG